MPPPLKHKITNDNAIPLPARIDKALVYLFPHFSRRAIRRFLDVGGVYLNRKRVRIASRQVHSGDEVEIIPTTTPPTLEQSAVITTLYEDEQVIVVNKPPCLPTQATRAQAVIHLTGLLQRQHGHGLRLIHRLDQETSGAIVYAKSQAVARFLAEQFKDQQVRKTYLALVYGIPHWQQHLCRSYLTPIRGSVGLVHAYAQPSKQTKLAITRFTLLACSQSVALIKCEPHTGRSHQIRVQLQSLGLPIVGDKKYGDNRPDVRAPRHMLHASQLACKLPHRQVLVQAPLAADFQAQVERHLPMHTTALLHK